jgi:hypothetical protein
MLVRFTVIYIHQGVYGVKGKSWPWALAYNDRMKEILTEHDAGRVWQRMFEAEVRALYFGDLTNRNTKIKQFITGMSFVLSSGAVVTIVSKSPAWAPAFLSLVVAIMSAYSIAVGLDKRVRTLSDLHTRWNRLQFEYERLWHHWFEDGAVDTLRELAMRSSEASEIGTEMPYDENRIHRWERFARARLQQNSV